METLRISGGHRFRLQHGPNAEVHRLTATDTVAFSPRGLRFLQPRVLVKEGDEVLLGEPLVEHKRDPRIKFVSPAHGVVQEIRFGERRVLEAVVIRIDHHAHARTKIDATSHEDVEKFLLENGLWGYLTCFPHSGFAPLSDQAQKICAVHVNLLRTEAHSPDAKILLQHHAQEFRAGIAALRKLAPQTRIFVQKGASVDEELKRYAQIVATESIYPADNLGVQAWYSERLDAQQCVIGADPELVIDVGHLLLHGHKRTERLYCLAGNAVKTPQHYWGALGMGVGDLTSGRLVSSDDVRLVAGGVLTGTKTRFQDFLGANDVALQAIVEDKKRIPLVFFRLGLDRLTMSRAWLSGFRAQSHEASTNNNGEERACIQCGYCIDACPVELMPNLIMKAAKTGDVEKLLTLSINDCVDCGLCTFVCPSKIELGQEIDHGKALVAKEG